MQKGMLTAAVRLFLEEAEKMGTLEDILDESKYRKDEFGRWVAPRLVATEHVSVSYYAEDNLFPQVSGKVFEKAGFECVRIEGHFCLCQKRRSKTSHIPNWDELPVL